LPGAYHMRARLSRGFLLMVYDLVRLLMVYDLVRG